jgi:hypothetical protein
LPLFFGSILFLGWLCRYFEETTLYFVLFVLLLAVGISLYLLARFFSDFPNSILREALLILVALIIIHLKGYFVKITNKHETIRKYSDEIYTLLSVGVILVLAILLFDFSKNTLYETSLILAIPVLALAIDYVIKNRNNEKNITKFLNRTRSVNIIGIMLMWPAVLVYYYTNRIGCVSFFGIEGLKFPVYIITASFIGVLSYLLLSIEDTFSHLIPEHEKMGISWSYLRRIFIAPFIAIIGFYLLFINRPEGLNDINDRVVFIFSFFAGVFTKSIEDWIYAWVQKILPPKESEEFKNQKNYDVEKSVLVQKLGLDEDLVYILYKLRIRTIEDLASCDSEELFKKVNVYVLDPDSESKEDATKSQDNKQVKDPKYSKQQIQMCIKKAKKYMGIDESELVTILKMDKDLAFKLYKCASIETIEDLSTYDKKCLSNRLIGCNEEVNEDTIEKYRNKANDYVKTVKRELVTVLKMERDLAFKLYECAQIKTIDDLNKADETKIYNGLIECKEEIDVYKIKKYKEMAKEYMKIDESELVIKLNMRKDLAFKLSYFAKITVKDLKDLKDKKWEEVSNKLGVCKDDVSKNEIIDLINEASK